MKTQSALLLGAAALGGFFYLKHKGGEALKTAGAAVNPTSQDNLAYRGVNAIGDILDDGGDNNSFSLGIWMYEFFHGENG